EHRTGEAASFPRFLHECVRLAPRDGFQYCKTYDVIEYVRRNARHRDADGALPRFAERPALSLMFVAASRWATACGGICRPFL
ncbi:MAG: hypothetical protein K2O70_11115, partial [Desulfovibrionaceae bacterium]|nr:hypothetical protein [Desulfovibrionaceae bacterium]